METSLTSYGYKVLKKNLTPDQCNKIKKDMMILPYVYDPIKGGQNKDKKFNILSESPKAFYLPRFYGIDNFDDYYSKKLKNLRIKELKKFQKFRFIKMDICKRDLLKKKLKDEKFTYIVHLAAQTSARFSELKPKKYIKDIFGDLWEGITGIFSGDFSTENFGKIFGSLFDIITNPLNLAINAIMDIFGFGEDESDFGQKTPFRLSEFISKKIRDIIAIFTDWFSTIKIPSIGEIVSMAKDGFSKIGSFLFGDGDSDEEKIDKLYTKQEKILKEAQGLPATQRQEKMKEFKSVQTEIDAVQKKNSISNVATISDAQLQNTQPSKLEKMRMTGGTDGADAVASSGNTINATPTKNSAPIIINAPTNTSQSSINNKTTQVAASVMVEPDPFFRRNAQYDF